MRLTITILLLLSASLCEGQINLVLNPSLEKYDTCPVYIDGIKYANNWMQLDSSWSPPDWPHCPQGVPEYCNLCATNPEISIPLSIYYNHYPHSGNAMAQIQTFYNESYSLFPQKRDYLQGHLSVSLIAGQSYCVSFYTILEKGSMWAINHMGAYLDDGTIDTTHDYGLPQTQYTPQVFSTTIINDTLTWVKVTGSFIANGTERLITIGNFSDYSHTLFAPAYGRDTTGTYRGASYSWYLVDDISVIRSDAHPNAGPNHSIPVGGVDSVIIGDTLDTYLPVYWYVNGVKIDSNKASIKVKPDTTTTYVIGLSLCGGGGEATVYDTVTVYVGSLVTSPSPLVMMKPLIYPNPVDNQITIAQAIGTILTISDLPGREVLRTNLNSNTEQVDLSALLPGVYIVHVSNPATGEKVVKRVVKE